MSSGPDSLMHSTAAGDAGASLEYGLEPESWLRKFVRRWGRRIGLSLLILGLVLFSVWCGFYWGYRTEQNALAALGPGATTTAFDDLIGWQVTKVLCRAGPAVTRVREIWISQFRAGD